ncbi:MAG: septal ring lytic transglycosylase RlpA family protein [Treponema sp.]|jgi:rare lipoprotein A|nr:septal ring lytic transglycosylase RlpA family protein [Treponema sp.]
MSGPFADKIGMKRIYSLLCTGLFIAFFYVPLAGAQDQPGTGGQIFRQEGIASWYGTEFDGRPTASGEIFNSTLLTAAHPTLPFGTVLTITNTHNNRTVRVRVNDRGPFVSARILDVSRAAAEQLDMLATGTAPVIAESLGPVAFPSGTDTETAPAISAVPGGGPGIVDPGWTPAAAETPAAVPPSPQAAMPPQYQAAAQAPEYGYSGGAAVLKPAISPIPNKLYRLQVGAYRIARNAVEAFEKLKNAGLNPAYERNGEFFRVVLAEVRGEDVQALTEKISSAGFREALIREER